MRIKYYNNSSNNRDIIAQRDNYKSQKEFIGLVHERVFRYCYFPNDEYTQKYFTRRIFIECLLEHFDYN